jgi:hypothetical protein
MTTEGIQVFRVVVALDPALMIPALSMAGALLVGALIVAMVRRWHQKDSSLGPSASDQLAEFRTLYEQGQISAEEFKRLRNILSEEIRREHALPPSPLQEIRAEAKVETDQDKAGDGPPSSGPGIHPG